MAAGADADFGRGPGSGRGFSAEGRSSIGERWAGVSRRSSAGMKACADGFLFEETPGGGRTGGARGDARHRRRSADRSGHFAAEQRTGVDLARGGLLRATLIETWRAEYGFLLRASRMVADDTALAILCEELSGLWGRAAAEPLRTYSDSQPGIAAGSRKPESRRS